AALQDGMLQERITTVRDARATAIARRKLVLTGASEFPDLNEAPGEVLDVAPVTVEREALPLTFPALAPIRLAEPFERLRDRSDAILSEKGVRPRVFLANLGSHADFTARATFAKSFFVAGGIEAIGSDGGNEAEIAAAFKQAGTSLVCL